MERDLAGLTIANRYDLLELLGRGGMGAVYRAHDRELDEMIAFKVIRPDLSSPAMLDSFRQEVKLARRVTHVNVARTFELGLLDGVMFCTMELVEGESLRRRLGRDGALPIAEAAAIARAMCEGLGAAHAAGVIHRDIKPDNVLLSADGRVVIVDFGVAALTTTDDRGFAGTLEYMAPEQARGESPTPASDVYAVGLVLYEMVSGLRAFAGTMSELIVAKHDVERLTFDLADVVSPVRIPDQLREVIERATEPSPAQRIASARALGEELSLWADQVPIERRSPEVPSSITAVVVFAPHATGDGGAMHIAEGVHQDLLRQLSARSRLRVLPRALGAAVPEDAATITLTVRDHVLDAEVRHQGHAIRIELPLEIRAIAAAATTIAHALADANIQPATVDDSARALLLQARLAGRRSFAGGEQALELLQRAYALAPTDWTIAAELAALLARLYLFRESLFEQTREFIQTIRERAPALSESHIAAAYLELHTGDPAMAATEFRAAIARAPYQAGGHEGLGRMLLEAGFLADARRRLDDALAIAPDLITVRWELARAHALEQNWLVHDQLMAGLADDTGRVFDRMRFAWWRGDRATLLALHARLQPTGFAPALVARTFAVALGEPWPAHRDEILHEARIVRSPSNRMLGLKAQLAAEAASFAGDVGSATVMIEAAIDHQLYDLHWYERCPSLDAVRRSTAHESLRRRIKLRADAILDALYCDRVVSHDRQTAASRP